MTVPDQIIVLHHTPYSEKSVILHTLSRQWGRRSFLVRDARALMAYFQPLSILDCDIIENPKSQLYTARNFVEIPLGGIRYSIGKNSICFFMAEVIMRAVKEGTQEAGLYEWCIGTIKLLDMLSSDYSNFHVRFLLDFASAMGFEPSLEDLLPFVEDSAAVVARFLESDLASSMLISMTGAQRSILCTRLLKYLEFHLEAPLRIRSLAVLGELF